MAKVEFSSPHPPVGRFAYRIGCHYRDLMAQIKNVLICCLAMSALWTLAGLPFARRVVPSATSWLLAPAIGFALFNVIALPLFEVAGMTRGVALAYAIIASAGGVLLARRQMPAAVVRRDCLILLATAVLAVALAAAPMAAVLPKEIADGVTLASPIFDHSKVGMVDEMIRAGVPPRNPFFFETEIPDRIGYYYLWHFGAATIAVMTGASGWEADAALTFFTGFAFLTAAGGLAIWLSGGRTAAGLIAIVLAAPASLRFLLEGIGQDTTVGLIGSASGFGGWLFQTSWAPQHVASATCVVLSCILLHRLAFEKGWIGSITLGLVAAAGFQCSVWVGGIVFALAAAVIGWRLLSTMDAAGRRPFLLQTGLAAAIAAVFSAPFIIDQVALTALRGGHLPLVIAPVEVFGDAILDGLLRRLVDLPAYWFIYLPVEFPAFYLAGLAGAFVLLRDRSGNAAMRQTACTLALVAVVSLVTAWLLRSVIANNNDLGWRAILPAVMLLPVFASAAIVRWRATPARVCAVLAGIGVLLGLPEAATILSSNMFGTQQSPARAFKDAPAIWAAVRRNAGETERIANNPLYLADMTPWPVNISWALLANRRSCYAGKELAIAFAPIPPIRRNFIDALFVRLFAGEGAPEDVEQLASRFHCDVILVTPADGAWQRDIFAASGIYRIVETKPDAWRIYRRSAFARSVRQDQ